MQTDIITVSNNGEGAEDALNESTRFSNYVGLDEKQALRIRLLAEEMIGMVKAISGEFTGKFWIENTSDKVCQLHLVASTDMNADKKKEFINSSSNKKNAASTGVMGKIRELFENSLFSINDMADLQTEFGAAPVLYGSMGLMDVETSVMNSCIYQWSLEKYRHSVEETKDSNEGSTKAWDELERSIVASIADDVKVGVKGNEVELVIEKKY